MASNAMTHLATPQMSHTPVISQMQGEESKFTDKDKTLPQFTITKEYTEGSADENLDDDNFAGNAIKVNKRAPPRLRSSMNLVPGAIASIKKKENVNLSVSVLDINEVNDGKDDQPLEV